MPWHALARPYHILRTTTLDFRPPLGQYRPGTHTNTWEPNWLDRLFITPRHMLYQKTLIKKTNCIAREHWP